MYEKGDDLNIALLDVHNKNYDKIAELAFPGKERYCEKHGYDFIRHTFTSLEPAHRGPTWGRVAALKEHLPKYDWILYLDTDTIILNKEIRIEDQLSEKNVVVGLMPEHQTGRPTHVSTSAILMRSCDWSMSFIDDWYSQTQFIDNPYHNSNSKSTNGHGGLFLEQSAFHFMYDKTNGENIEIRYDSWFNYRYGTPGILKGSASLDSEFLVHFPRQDNKLQRMKKFLSERVKVI